MALNLDLIQAQLNEMKEYISEKDIKNSSVSSAPVEWHLSHSLKVINNIISSLESSDPGNFKKEFSFWKVVIFLTRKIPRGRARSPKAVLPPEDITLEHLKGEWSKAKQNVSLINSFPGKAHFEHPYFKHLDRNQTKKFLEIHTEHHLKIIREILEKG
ncbi:hypothetical protein SAMN04488034_102396 [Salinimicrobium catena]|uniref:DUF1569 domain-containing protein n=1 Tax=Salinimicrobium catena TaxID=390640 RepID=A0A1H5LRV8_9FLAO|nr:hypothetical protein [Salinimicrobium catena]SDL13478.1 hypothetical protein SAMN04488140_102396 [Salinimicrobium catena]SEE79803.1 hypothetical protein SAMN04488034_102396 [Salinimicrobium catena]